MYRTLSSLSGLLLVFVLSSSLLGKASAQTRLSQRQPAIMHFDTTPDASARRARTVRPHAKFDVSKMANTRCEPPCTDSAAQVPEQWVAGQTPAGLGAAHGSQHASRADRRQHKACAPAQRVPSKVRKPDTQPNTQPNMQQLTVWMQVCP
jgi:hypothetical protein